MHPLTIVKSTVFVAVTATGLGFSSTGHAALLATPIENADFEAGGPVGTFSASVIDWAEGDAAGYSTAFTQDEDSNSAVPFDGTDLDGDDNWGGVQFGTTSGQAGPGEIYQQIGTVTGNESYTVNMNVGYRSDRPWGNLVVTLFSTDSGTGAAADADTLDGTRSASIAGYTVLDTYIYTTTPDTTDGDAISFQLDSGTLGTDGNPLWIAFSMNGAANPASQTFVDDISIAIVPEPASLALMGLGGLMMLGRSRRA